MLKDLNLKRIGLYEKYQKLKVYDAGVAAIFVAAIALLLVAAGYVIHRLAKDHAYREKWKDYNDCGWA